MADETKTGFGQGGNDGHGASGSASEPTPLQGRTAFLQNWSWEFVVHINQRLCGGGKAQHGKNSETYESCEKEWSQDHTLDRSILDTLEWLRSFHRKAPFLFFNGNTFSEIARTLTDALFAEFPTGRRRQAASLAAHFVAGVLDRDPLVEGMAWLAELADFKPGDRVKTLKGTTRGVIVRLLSDGRVVWRPLGGASELMALPESLVRLKTGSNAFR